MTQKTGLGGRPPRDQEPPEKDGDWIIDPVDADIIDPTFDDDDRESLGLQPEDPHIADPTGWAPESTAAHEIMGRKMIKLSPKDLEKLHESHAPGQSMVDNDPTKELSDRKLPDPDDIRERDLNPNREASPSELLGDYARNTQEKKTKPNTATIKKPTGARIGPGEVGEAVRVVETLLNRSVLYREQGDLKLSSELNAIARSIIDSNNIRRVQEPRERHPALQVLLNNIGLEKIEPVKVSWLGNIWVFAPKPEELDFWIAENVRDGGIDISICLIAASLVGMGEDSPGASPPDPLWKVFNMGLSCGYELTRESTLEGIPDETEAYDVQVYYKTCESCSTEVPVQDAECRVCGAFQDIYDVPLTLRRRYANATKDFIQSKLGLGHQEWGNLVDEMRKVMKDRRLDREELYPLALPLFKARTTPG